MRKAGRKSGKQICGQCCPGRPGGLQGDSGRQVRPFIVLETGKIGLETGKIVLETGKVVSETGKVVLETGKAV